MEKPPLAVSLIICLLGITTLGILYQLQIILNKYCCSFLKMTLK